MQRTVAQIAWRSNITLLDKPKDPNLRLWYAHKAIEKGMGRAMLAFQIEGKLHLRDGSEVSNFKQAFKDPYIFDFVGNVTYIRKRGLEQSLIDHIQKFFLELGKDLCL